MENTTGKLSVKRADGVHTVDVTEDFILPDYISEIRRVIGVQGNAAIDGKYLNGSELEADGAVTYNVLYLGGDGGLCAVPLTSSFEDKVPLKTEEGDRFGTDDIALSASAENVLCRVTAPRRVTLSCRVKMQVLSQKEIDCSEKTDPSELASSVRVKYEKADYAVVKSYRNTLECGGELREREGTKVISAQGSVIINETKTTPQGIAASGEGRISLLLLTPDGIYTTAKSRCAIDTLFPCDTDHIHSAAAAGRCLMCEVETAEDGVIAWNMECDIDCDALTGGETRIAVDGYCTDYEDECVFSDYRATSPLKGLNGRLTLSASKTIRTGMTYAGGFGRASFDKAELSEGKLVLSGNAAITAILCGNGEATAEECVVPVKYECNADCPSSCEITGKWEAAVCDVSGRCDGENLNLTAELALSGIFLAEQNVRPLTLIRIDSTRPTEHKRNIMKIYVPDGSETEWDVMKRYRIAADSPRKSGKIYIVS